MNQEKLGILTDIYKILKSPKKESLEMSMDNVHAKNTFSLVIDGTEPGRLTRVFIAKKAIKPYDVQLHTHRYPITLIILQGNIVHHTARYTDKRNSDAIKISEFEYKSPLNGGEGLRYLYESFIKVKSTQLPIGCIIEMGSDEFHTMSCSKDSIWIVIEKGFETNSSKVLGIPFITENLYKKSGFFQVNDNVQVVKKAIKTIINSYQVL